MNYVHRITNVGHDLVTKPQPFSSYQVIFLADIFANYIKFCLISNKTRYNSSITLNSNDSKDMSILIKAANLSQFFYQMLIQYGIFPRSYRPKSHPDQFSKYVEVFNLYALTFSPLTRTHLQVNFHVKTKPEISQLFCLSLKKPPPFCPSFFFYFQCQELEIAQIRCFPETLDRTFTSRHRGIEIPILSHGSGAEDPLIFCKDILGELQAGTESSDHSHLIIHSQIAYQCNAESFPRIAISQPQKNKCHIRDEAE